MRTCGSIALLGVVAAGPALAQETICDDGFDNDGDQWIDCYDDDCPCTINETKGECYAFVSDWQGMSYSLYASHVAPDLREWLYRVDLDDNNLGHPDGSPLCNDGTPPIMLIRPAAAASERWLIHFYGGGNCDDEPGCTTRWTGTASPNNCSKMSTYGWTHQGYDIGWMGGIADNVSSPWLENYNLVVLNYCSSDNWTGDTPVAAPAPMADLVPVTGDYIVHFHGHRIVAEAIETLLQGGVVTEANAEADGLTPLPSLATATRVILTGDPRGGAGLVHNARYIYDAVKAVNPALLKNDFRLVRDASAGPTLEIDGETAYESAVATKELESFAGPWAWFGGNAQCQAYHAGAQLDPAACVDDLHVNLNHLSFPTLMRQSLADTVVGPPSPQQWWAGQVAEQLRVLRAVADGTQAVYETDYTCAPHAPTITPNVFGLWRTCGSWVPTMHMQRRSPARRRRRTRRSWGPTRRLPGEPHRDQGAEVHGGGDPGQWLRAYLRRRGRGVRGAVQQRGPGLWPVQPHHDLRRGLTRRRVSAG